MAGETFLSNWVVSDFILPFVLIFALVFALLEKTKLIGERHQLNAIVAFVVGLIFVAAIFPKQVVGNLVLFLTVSLIVVFVGLLIWGFLSGGEIKVEGGVKKFAAVALIIALIIAVLWAVGLKVEFFNQVTNFLFYSSWSSTFWLNVTFVGVIAIALALILKTSGGK
ncbi:hypothetical protein HY449_04010 [Candidatus Pacearchaeota archaeon]|nr:hypothetical protein [Candidatus Pacearchaeota archaeon]